MDPNRTRIPNFMGSWYQEDAALLTEELNKFIERAHVKKSPNLKGIIVPHAGYKYSGQTAAYSYGSIDPSRIKRIFILGPLHHLSTKRCSLPHCLMYKTQLGTLKVDIDVINNITKEGTFEEITKEFDQGEHSIELQLNYISHIMKGYDFTIVPIYVGSLSDYDLLHYSQILSPYLIEDGNLFVVSSDFCHYGKSFDYEPFKQESNVENFIINLDNDAIKSITSISAAKFQKHLLYSRNTICGRNPINLFLSLIEHLTNFKMVLNRNQVSACLLKYTRSKPISDKNDSSVGYASIIFNISSA